MSKLRVAVIAPPWLAMPIIGYGGIELVLEGLVAGVREANLPVELVFFANGERKLKGIKTHSIYNTEQYDHIHQPIVYTLPILLAHLQFAINEILRDGKFDIIHDHTGYAGPILLAMATQLDKVPPTLHTFHGPPFSTDYEDNDHGFPSDRLMFEQMENLGKWYGVCISDTYAKNAPDTIKRHLLPTVYNAIDLEIFPFLPTKKNYFITLARFSPEKGQHVAARAAAKLKVPLRMAGTVAGIESGRKLLLELSNPMSPYRNMDDFRYYSDKILPLVVRHPRITYSGNMSGSRKMKFVAEAKALLFPIQWEEPFGMAVIEALACGTPVVAMNRGAMPEIIEHGVTGFLANNEQEFVEYMKRVDEIDPLACRKAVEEKFSAGTMATAYLERYKQIIELEKKKKSKKK